MARKYQPTSEWALAVHGEDVVELDLSAADEADLVPAHLGIVPASYRVLSTNYAASEQGSQVEMSLPVDIEAALVQGGHLKRVDTDPEPKPRGRGTNPKKED
jgi:hypothetical protein